MSDGKLSRKARSAARWTKLGALAALALVGLVLVAQNTEVVTVRLLTWEVSMSLIVLLPAVIGGGFLAGYLVGRRRGRRGGSGPAERAAGGGPAGRPDPPADAAG